jgi:hypothetical protein
LLFEYRLRFGKLCDVIEAGGQPTSAAFLPDWKSLR